MDGEDTIFISSAALTLDCAIRIYTNQNCKKPRMKQKIWVMQWLKERVAKGAYSNYYLNLTENMSIFNYRLCMFGMYQNYFFSEYDCIK